jgi:hypothetical protein
MNVPFYYPLHETPHDFFRYTEFGLRRFMESSEMRVVYLEPIGGAVEIISDILSKNIVRIPVAGLVAAKVLQQLSWWFVSSRVGSRISRKTSSQFPLGYFMVAERNRGPSGATLRQS